MEKKYARAKKLAEHLGVGLSTIWRWKKQGKIKSYQLSKGVTVFDLNEVLLNLELINNNLLDGK
jgi:predicted site-specific integrase-resolvase